MLKNLILIFFISIAFLSCEKKEEPPQFPPFSIKLSGKYFRDSALTNNGYKMLDLREDGNYCWVRTQNGKDSLYCYGTYQQTSDTSMLWNGKDLIVFKTTKIDTIPNGIKLVIAGIPVVPALYGYYK
jgi:hypothetical protein